MIFISTWAVFRISWDPNWSTKMCKRWIFLPLTVKLVWISLLPWSQGCGDIKIYQDIEYFDSTSHFKSAVGFIQVMLKLFYDLNNLNLLRGKYFFKALHRKKSQLITVKFVDWCQKVNKNILARERMDRNICSSPLLIGLENSSLAELLTGFPSTQKKEGSSFF